MYTKRHSRKRLSRTRLSRKRHSRKRHKRKTKRQKRAGVITPPPLTITVTHLSGQVIELEVAGGSNIGDIKTLIERIEGIKLYKQQLYNPDSGEELQDTDPIIDNSQLLLAVKAFEPIRSRNLLRKMVNYWTNNRTKYIAKIIEKYGDISDWDTSGITDMNNIFLNKRFNGDISAWDVSNVTDMTEMFRGSQFNGDISDWDVSNVTNMKDMFWGSLFNNDISRWNVSNVTNMDGMFYASAFNDDITGWDISSVINMKRMFFMSQFNGDISGWDISNVTVLHRAFDNIHFQNNPENQPRL